MTIAHLAEDQGDFGENPGCMSCLVLLARGFERIYPGGVKQTLPFPSIEDRLCKPQSSGSVNSSID